jgi:hypothetical protein|nr:MAG TPA: hypothetical protein [Caudoviricetes sp.]
MSLKSRIEALILQISNAKTSLRSALSNKGVSVPISPTWDQITQGINDIEIPVMPNVSLSFSSGTYSVSLGGSNFNTSRYSVYYNNKLEFNPGTISIIVDWMNSNFVNKVIVWCVVSSQITEGAPKSFLAISELNQGTNWSQQVLVANRAEWRGGIMRLTKATAASGGTILTFRGNHVLISYNN